MPSSDKEFEQADRYLAERKKAMTTTSATLQEELKLAAEYLCYHSYDIQHGSINGRPRMEMYYCIKEVPLNDDDNDTHTSLYFHTRWDWQVPLFSKVANELVHSNLEFVKNRWVNSVIANDHASGFAVLIEAIKWLQENKK